MSTKLLVIVLAWAVAVVGASAWALWPRDADEVTQRAAVAEFRKRDAGETSRPGDASKSAEQATPDPGVYRYEATGTEKTKSGPLPESENPLPSTVTGAVVTKPSGCFACRLSLFEQHTEDSRFCSEDDGFTPVSYAKHQTVGTLTATAKVTCDNGALIGVGADRQDLDCVLRLEGGPFTVEANFTGTSKVGASEKMTIGAHTFEVTPVTVHFEFTGKVQGTWTEKTWFTHDHLPARIERSLTMMGTASFDEHFDLKLASLPPTT